jgi:hypothetical protein
MREVVQDAMEEIGVKTAEIELTGDELQSGIRRCNDMLLEWEDSGVIAGYSEVLNGDDVLNIDRSAVGAVKYNLAIRLAPSYQKAVGHALVAIAQSTMEAVQASNSYIGDIAFPGTLPMGSGNQYDTFFPVDETENF